MATWTAKTMMATTKAPRNDFRLIPWKPWALPALPSTADCVLVDDCVVDVDDRTVDAAVVAADDTVLAADDTNDVEDIVDDMVAPGGSGSDGASRRQPSAGRREVRGS